MTDFIIVTNFDNRHIAIRKYDIDSFIENLESEKALEENKWND